IPPSTSVMIGHRAYSQTTPDASRGRFIRIVEVSPRDGLQNLPLPAVPTQTKLDLIAKLTDAGLRNIEVGSFVRPDRVVQMADSPVVLRSLPPAAHYPVLVPNARWLDELLALEDKHQAEGGKERLTDEIAVFVSATEPFSLANNNASRDKVMDGLKGVIDKAHSRGYRVRGYVSCVMTDPFAGPTDPNEVVGVSRRLLEMGCYEISLGDTTGEGNPDQWRRLWFALQESGIDTNKLAAHCHDTFAMSLPSLLALLPLGLRTIDSSLAGLGGCPYSPGATGNVPTEDVVYMLHKMGYETGVDLEKLVEAGDWLSRTLAVKNESRVGRAIHARRV
ncbi:HMGCL protein, partial [Spelaeornis formosus]|nr:HMGCL protein [Elachura formosa]